MTRTEAQSQTPEAPARQGWLHWLIVIVVFSITGSLAVWVARLLLHDALGLEGGFWTGPWTYRLAYLALIPPCYSVMLVIVGTVFGKGVYFRSRAVRMWSRLLPRGLRERARAWGER